MRPVTDTAKSPARAAKSPPAFGGQCATVAETADEEDGHPSDDQNRSDIEDVENKPSEDAARVEGDRGQWPEVGQIGSAGGDGRFEVNPPKGQRECDERSEYLSPEKQLVGHPPGTGPVGDEPAGEVGDQHPRQSHEGSEPSLPLAGELPTHGG